MQPLTFTEVVHVDSASKDELFESARLWFAETFRDSKAVIQISDKEGGEIVGKGNMRYSSSIFVGSTVTSGWIFYIIKINFKEGRYRLEITEFRHEGTRGSNSPPKSFGLITKSAVCPYSFSSLFESEEFNTRQWNDIKATIANKTPSIISSLKTAMAKQSVKEEDW